jgi:hypothetical protein
VWWSSCGGFRGSVFSAIAGFKQRRARRQREAMVVVEFAKSSRAKCHSCSSCIGEGNIKYGTAINNDGYLNMQWHHEGCFWNKRVGKYFRRKGKKINYTIKYEQFSNTQILSLDQTEELKERILETNLKYGTDEALAKVGIIRPDRGEEIAPPVKQTGRKRKEVAPSPSPPPGAVEDEDHSVRDMEPDLLPLDPLMRVTRSRAKRSRA